MLPDGSHIWTSAHLPKTSLVALENVRQLLNDQTVLLDVPGENWSEVVHHLVDHWVELGWLHPMNKEFAKQVLQLHQYKSTHKPKSPQMKKGASRVFDIHERDEQALDILVCHTNLVESSAVSFVRLYSSLDLHLAGHVPVRMVSPPLPPPTHPSIHQLIAKRQREGVGKGKGIPVG